MCLKYTLHVVFTIIVQDICIYYYLPLMAVFHSYRSETILILDIEIKQGIFKYSLV